MFGHLCKVMIAGQQNMGKALVIFQEDIKTRPQLFDQICFQQECFNL